MATMSDSTSAIIVVLSDFPLDVNSSWSTMSDNSSNISLTSSPLTLVEVSWLDDRCRLFQFFFNTVLIGALCLFGIATNILAIIVLAKDRHNQVATFLLRSLAAADIAVLIVVFLTMSVFFGTAQIPVVYDHFTGFMIPYLKKYVNPIGYMTQSATIWITVLVAINRYIAVVHPFRAHRFLTIRIAQLQVTIVFILSVLVNIPRFFQIDIVQFVSNNVTYQRTKESEMGASRAYEIVFLNVFCTAIIFILPLIILVVLNAIILTELQMSKKRMAGNMQGSSANKIGNREKNITFVIIVVVMIVVVCHAPDRALTVFKAFNKSMACPDPIAYWQQACNLLIVLNSATNFVVYCVFRPRFRRILLTRVCTMCGRKNDGFDDSTSFNGSVRRQSSYAACDSGQRVATDDSRRPSSSHAACDSQRQRRLRFEQQFSTGSAGAAPLLLKTHDVDEKNGLAVSERSTSLAGESSNVNGCPSLPRTPISFTDSQTCFIPPTMAKSDFDDVDGGVDNRVSSSRSTSFCDVIVEVDGKLPHSGSIASACDSCQIADGIHRVAILNDHSRQSH